MEDRPIGEQRRELRTQASDLKLELRALEYSTPISLLQMSSDDLAIQAETELRELELMRDFVTSFRDGKIALAQFMHGPDLGHDDELDLDALAVDFVLEELARRSRPAKKPPKAKRRSR